MTWRVLADLVAVVHLLFVLFVLFGGFLVMRWPRMAWIHLPSVAWGITVEMMGWICPLTHLENRFRFLGWQEGYGESFIDHYILPLIYPALLLGETPPRALFITIGVAVFVINAALYRQVLKRRSALSSDRHDSG
ncbi:MAG: DUF2784 domain-containing protein [Magnetococcales bacterium]|nr:DUF2784 domain-containing protein [Magnetococcales bacterium]